MQIRTIRIYFYAIASEPQGFIEVWMTNEERETIDRRKLTAQILADAGHPKKCKVVYFLSDSADLTKCMSSRLRSGTSGVNR